MPEITSPLPLLALVVVLAYMLGAIPFGVVIARAFGLGDLRAIGSGNIGATNVLRTGNKLAAALTLICDSGKGAAAVLLARWLVGPDAAQVAGLFAFLGHLYPVYLRFQGGKGVATFLGTLLALSFPLGFAACMTWLAMAVVSRISSAAALVASLAAAGWAWGLGMPQFIVLCLVLAAMIWIKHRANIARILAGEEPKIGAKSG